MHTTQSAFDRHNDLRSVSINNVRRKSPISFITHNVGSLYMGLFSVNSSGIPIREDIQIGVSPKMLGRYSYAYLCMVDRMSNETGLMYINILMMFDPFKPLQSLQ